ncbi:MAG TPA: TrkA C-terminal domain-containing protein [Candidatus Glassbacteria bacterium]|nr:TrkA C-terminal domain-containing protein [Candidatus Glassbacteria bacterium]
MLGQFISHPVAALFLIVALGSALGAIKISNISLGASGVLFVALLFGHLGVELPVALQELGIILFVYAVGLQAGPRFFNQFRARGVVYAKIGVVVVAAGALLTWGVSRLAGIDPALAIGMFAGAMTSTPGLAAAMDAARDPTVSVGYGIAYPFGVIGVVLFVQLLPRLLKVDLGREQSASDGSEILVGKLVGRRQFVVSNPACEGKTLIELKLHSITEVNISRISRGGRVEPARPDFRFQKGDVLLAVGKEEELDKLRIVFGEETHGEEIFTTHDVIARDVFVSHPEMTGKSLAGLGVF